MRKLIRPMLFAALASAVVMSPLQAFVALGHGRLVGTATARADYDSNIFVNSTEVDDYVGTITGGVRYVHDASTVTFDAGIGATVLTFADHSEQNAFDPSIDANFGYTPSDKTSLLGKIGFKRNSQANEIVNNRTEANEFIFEGSFQHLTTEKVGFRIATDYSSANYHTSGYSDVLHYSLGLHGVYVYSPKLKLLAGLTRLEWWTEQRAAGRSSPSSTDWRYTVTAEGEISPKVTGDFSIGGVQRSADTAGFSDSNTLYLASRLAWAATEKTTFRTELAQDLSISAADQSVKSLRLTLGVTQALTEKLVFDGSIGADRTRFASFRGVGDRRDNGWVIRGRLGYSFTDTTSFDVSGGFRNNDSNLGISTYDRFNLGLGANVRF